MQEKKPIIKSILITSIFILVGVGLVPLLLLHYYPPASFFASGVLRYPGVIAFIIGAAVSLSCVKDFLFKGRGTPAPFDPPRTLVVEGFYKYVRNPMYLGLFLVILGEALFFPSSALFVYLMVLIAFANFFVRLYEEPRLSRKFGRSYEEYCISVDRWIPKFAKRTTRD